MVSGGVEGGLAGNEANLDALIQGGGDPLEHGQRMALIVRIPSRQMTEVVVPTKWARAR